MEKPYSPYAENYVFDHIQQYLFFSSQGDLITILSDAEFKNSV